MKSLAFGLQENCFRSLRRAGKSVRLAAILLLQLGLLLGVPRQSLQAQAEPAAISARARPTRQADSDERITQQWYVITTDAGCVGHAHFRHSVRGDGTEQDQQWMVLRFQRFGSIVTQNIVTTCQFDTNGTLIRFSAARHDGQSKNAQEAERTGTGFHWLARRADETEDDVFQLPPHCGGFFAMERSLSSNPMHVSERRSFSCLVPFTARIGTTTLVAGEWQTLKCHPGQVRALRIEGHTEIDRQPLVRFLVWMDEQGGIARTEIPALGQTMQRTTREGAVADASSDRWTSRTANSDPTGDAGIAGHHRPLLAAIKTDRLIRIPAGNWVINPHAFTKATYEVRPASPEITRLLLAANCDYQTSEVLDDGAICVRVAARPIAIQQTAENRPIERESTGGAQVGQDDPTRENAWARQVSSRRPNAALLPSAIITSDAHQVVALSRSVAPNEKIPWKLALALEAFVYEFVTHKDYSRPLDNATEVIATRTGDCTEHSVLLAALCRARHIPSRFVAGLVYDASEQAFVAHAWTEVFTDGCWRPLDATRQRGCAGSGHIRLCSSPLHDESTAEATLPMTVLIGSPIRIELDAPRGVPR